MTIAQHAPARDQVLARLLWQTADRRGRDQLDVIRRAVMAGVAAGATCARSGGASLGSVADDLRVAVARLDALDLIEAARAAGLPDCTACGAGGFQLWGGDGRATYAELCPACEGAGVHDPGR